MPCRLRLRRPCCHGSRSGKRPNARRAGISQDARARVEGGPGRHHIIDQHQHSAAQALWPHALAPGQGIGTACVGGALCGRQARLRRARPVSSQGAPDREAQAHREVVGLIETALQVAPRMERHRHHRVGAVEDLLAVTLHACGEPGRDHAAPLVFERVDHVAQRAVVHTRAARQRYGWKLAAAPRTQGLDEACRQVIAAQGADRRRNRRHATPARPANRALERRVQRLITHRAAGREDGAENRVGGSGKHAAGMCKRLATASPEDRDVPGVSNSQFLRIDPRKNQAEISTRSASPHNRSSA